MDPRDAFLERFKRIAVRQVPSDLRALDYYFEDETLWIPPELALLAKVPVPVEPALARSLSNASQREAISLNDIFLCRVTHWVAEAFFEAGDALHPEAEENSLAFPFADVSPAEFDEICRSVEEFVKKAVASKAVRAQRALPTTAFPLSKSSISLIPLMDDGFIDEELLQLIVFAQMAREDAICLPPVDPNPAAFERIFPKGTNFHDGAAIAEGKLPEEVDDSMLDSIRERARRSIDKYEFHRRKLSELSCISLESIAKVNDEYFQPLEPARELDLTNTGVAITDWNRWIADKHPKVCRGKYTIRLQELPHSGQFPSQHHMASIENLDELREARHTRRELVNHILSACRSGKLASIFSIHGILDPKPNELKLTRLLMGRALTADELAAELGIGRSNLFRAGWLPLLQQCGIVKNDRRMGGYFLPTFPPPTIRLH